MEPDGPDRIDMVERAHLQDPGDRSHAMYRYGPPADLVDLVRRFWLPVWSVPPGQVVAQRVLQHPVALVVVTAASATFTGVARGMSTTELAGDGWAVGVLCQPATGSLLTGGSMHHWTDRSAALAEAVASAPASTVASTVHQVRQAMARDPHDAGSHRAAIGALAELLRSAGPVDEEGRMVNAIVERVETDPEVTSVAELCAVLGVSERALQRLTRRRLGLTPRWLIQRRRLHEACERLRSGRTTIAEVAATLGYADQPHLTRDVRSVTGMTPGDLVRQAQRPTS